MSKAKEAAVNYFIKLPSAEDDSDNDRSLIEAFQAGVKWVIEEAKKLADTCGHEGCEIRYSNPIEFKDLEALLKE